MRLKIKLSEVKRIKKKVYASYRFIIYVIIEANLFSLDRKD